MTNLLVTATTSLLIAISLNLTNPNTDSNNIIIDDTTTLMTDNTNQIDIVIVDTDAL